MIRFIKSLWKLAGAPASYPTRVWTVLAFPLLLGAALGWSSTRKLEEVLLGALVAALYSVALWIVRNKRLARARRPRREM